MIVCDTCTEVEQMLAAYEVLDNKVCRVDEVLEMKVLVYYEIYFTLSTFEMFTFAKLLC